MDRLVGGRYLTRRIRPRSRGLEDWLRPILWRRTVRMAAERQMAIPAFPPGLPVEISCRWRRGVERLEIEIALAEESGHWSIERPLFAPTGSQHAPPDTLWHGLTLTITRWIVLPVISPLEMADLSAEAMAFREHALNHRHDPSLQVYLPLYALVLAARVDLEALPPLLDGARRVRAAMKHELRERLPTLTSRLLGRPRVSDGSCSSPEMNTPD